MQICVERSIRLKSRRKVHAYYLLRLNPPVKTSTVAELLWLPQMERRNKIEDKLIRRKCKLVFALTMNTEQRHTGNRVLRNRLHSHFVRYLGRLLLPFINLIIIRILHRKILRVSFPYCCGGTTGSISVREKITRKTPNLMILYSEVTKTVGIYSQINRNQFTAITLQFGDCWQSDESFDIRCKLDLFGANGNKSLATHRQRRLRTTFSSTIFPISLSIARERFRAQPDPLTYGKKCNTAQPHIYTQNTLLTAFHGYFQFQWKRAREENGNTNIA